MTDMNTSKAPTPTAFQLYQLDAALAAIDGNLSEPINFVTLEDCDSIAHDALYEIAQSGLNKMRCSLTGAPYATIADSEILLALQTELTQRPDATVDHLVDAWSLRALTFCSSVAPSLRNVKSAALRDIMESGPDGQVRVLTYMLSRLFFTPDDRLNNGLRWSSAALINRMMFAANVYDSLVNWQTPDMVQAMTRLVQKLGVCDAHCSLTIWQTLPAWRTKRGLDVTQAERNARVQGWFSQPDALPLTVEALNEVADYCLELLFDAIVNDNPFPDSGNRLATSIYQVRVESAPAPVMPALGNKAKRRMTPAEIERRAEAEAQLAREREAQKLPRIRMAHSWTYGSQYRPNTSPGPKPPTKAQMKAQAKAQQAQTNATRKIKSAAKPGAVGSASTDMQAMAAVFASFGKI